MIIFGMMRKEIISYMRSTVKEKRIWAYFALIVVLGAGGGNFKFCSDSL